MILTVLLGDYRKKEYEIIQFKGIISINDIDDVIHEDVKDFEWNDLYINSVISLDEEQQEKDEKSLLDRWNILHAIM